MFSSLRSRLWLTYVSLVVTALSVVAVVLLIYLWRNPIIYRQTYERVQAAQKLIVARSFNALKETDRNMLDWTADNFEVRALIFSPGGDLLRDTLPSAESISLPADGLLRKKVKTRTKTTQHAVIVIPPMVIHNARSVLGPCAGLCISGAVSADAAMTGVLSPMSVGSCDCISKGLSLFVIFIPYD